MTTNSVVLGRFFDFCEGDRIAIGIIRYCINNQLNCNRISHHVHSLRFVCAQLSAKTRDRAHSSLSQPYMTHFGRTRTAGVHRISYVQPPLFSPPVAEHVRIWRSDGVVGLHTRY
jgi:hypothetical protein